ncbi:MAG TPA: NAD-dependent epimerase/dehydratase family protein [Candidatus Marinimicrobia bacterium]|nr:NAD-dependent epimerase/dehydratase family protein [Candidatus Neomarinimicrobiota bacterium]HPN74192.1 NAD-dependent epimerase/dehydratase family protein [Candidatus Neomarinimicrobiota bacterium]HPX99747.1 NAD-dependent epimerase/dehydratase family protein [Candidatus Neomarinimicrobiota bacterium]HQC61534.1 NAD-dependent epimerase/dehydratase family protein [Candidatus Neomarinimicrobiota bacterium]HQO74878.1 NAD-dependent epimerase/dehydratase family protein [Candidatus Neomarinimicrobio
MSILVTGSAGFIGFHLAHRLLQEGIEVVGYDNVNDYYDPSLKEARLRILNDFDKFKFYRADLCDFATLQKVFSDQTIEKVVHLAAQAGVRYSLINPFAYQKSNLEGFLNIIELSKCAKVKNFIYASSSSVYGNNRHLPFSVQDNVDRPISLYAATKKSNELIAHVYAHLYQLPCTGLRFFTVYGPFGRPDMALFIFTKNILEGKPIDVYNFGQMKRDFTYIDDIVAGLRSAIDKPFPYEIFNLGNHRSENLMDFIHLIEEYSGRKAQINFQPIQPGDVPETYADISTATEKLGFVPRTQIREGIKLFLDWYFEYYHIKK